MLTLKELRRELGGFPKKDERTPQYKTLLESGERILAQYIGNGSEVTVYSNGYVLYRGEARAVVFPFPKSRTYMYQSSCGAENIAIDEDELEVVGWYLRLILEGEDRLSHNANNRFSYRTVSYNEISEEWKELKDPAGSAEDIYFTEKSKETALDSLDLLTGKQRYVVTEHFLNGVPYIKLAEDMRISRQAVRDTAEKGLQRMRKSLEKRK
ncbi:MAG: hypothetical protein LUE20_03725 [Oscillospiraceae bacterium]|nr:hypothetical protein [Oscillospiraceae bacterium]